MTLQHLAEALCLAFAAFGSAYALVCVVTGFVFRARIARAPRAVELPPVTILKPLYGLDKNLLENLRAACSLDYPEYQVVLSVQRPDDPAILVMRQVEREFGRERVTVVVGQAPARANGKIQNLEAAWSQVRHDVVVISDSDIRLAPDYLRAIVEPLADPRVGCVCTPYRAIDAGRWFEKLELLTMNADFVPNLVFTAVLGLMTFGLGASMCFRRSDLEAIGGFTAFGDHLAEDYVMAARIEALGRRVVLAPYIVDMEVDLKNFAQWWDHQLYWDQNTRAMRPTEFFATVIVRAIPFALIYALLTGLSELGLGILASTIAVRVISAGLISWALKDREGRRALWLLPVRDVLGLVVWLVTMLKRDFVRRGQRFALMDDGRIVPRAPPPKEQGAAAE
ncbi:MAG TPA: bacteriohopanetetrol glucosamine biosynthesis glycosyltransferase HpnI [Rhizomicrobium sp.]|nr:bacteriohopanetetrol glucosamine biosynthesis glycosyltransferase HpnI [Rhizomicrobium sp.]